MHMPRVSTCLALLARPEGVKQLQPELCHQLEGCARKIQLEEHDVTWLDARVGRWEPEEEEEGAAQASLQLTVSFQCNAASQQAVASKLASKVLTATSGLLHKVDVLVVAPDRIPMLPEGLPEISTTADAIATPESLQTFARTGCAILIRDAVDTAALEELQSLAAAHIRRADDALSTRGVQSGTELFRFTEISARGQHRFDLLFDLGAEESAPLRNAALGGAWAPLVEALLGPRAVVQCSVVYSRPGAKEQEWHSDGPHVGKVADWTGEGQSPPYAICVFVPLIDLNTEVGFTQFWLGTHKYKGLIGFGGVAGVLGCAVDAAVGAGGAVLYDYRLMHRGMPNTSQATERPVLQFLYSNPEYFEKDNYGDGALFTERPIVRARMPVAELASCR